MRIVKHTIAHFFIHLVLFTGFALLVPVMTAAWDTKTPPWQVATPVFIAGALLIVVSAFLLHRMKESVPEVMQSLGQMMFIPGAFNVLFSFFSSEKFFASLRGITGGAVIEPAAKFYISHSVPTILSVAAVYMCVGGILYWVGRKIADAKDRFSWN